MKSNNILMILITLSFAGAVWLINKNGALMHDKVNLNREMEMLNVRISNVEEKIEEIEIDMFNMGIQLNRIESKLGDGMVVSSNKK